jgi:hypothetical protein
MATTVEVENNLNSVRGQVMTISRTLPTGAQYFTVEGKDVDLKFNDMKNQLMQNPQSPDLITNRGPRAIVVLGHSVFSQAFDQDIDGNNVVIFNKGMSDESRAAIVAGGVNFGQTTDDAMKDALRGELRIFADGIKTVTKANALNQAELDRWVALKNQIDRYCDSIRSTIASNKKKALDYQEAINKFKPEVDLGAGAVSVPVE